MSLVSALYTGVSGIQAFSQNMQIIGHNIANVNTAGFKSSNAIFADLVSANLGGTQVGRGTRLAGTQTSYTQGSFQTTSKATDMAIDGKGFFILSDGIGQTYTRTGIFGVNQDGFLVNNDNLFVQGFTFDAQGNLNQNLGNINLSNLVSPPNPTGDGVNPGSGVQIFANLDSAAPYTGAAFDVTNPIATSNFFTSVKVFDSLGNGHVVTIYFTKDDPATNPNSWSWNAVIDDADYAGAPPNPNPGQPIIQASGQLTFTDSGALDTETVTLSNFNFSGNVVQNQVIGFDFGDSITTDSGTGLGGTTQFASPSIVNFADQDGFSAGNLRGISIDNLGVITGVFSNGQPRQIAQVGLATFQNENGLLKTAGNRWSSSPDSGNPTIATGGTGAAGSILASTIELSNVDLSSEFVQLITTQRALQASSRVLTASDQMLNEVVNLIR